LAVGGKRHAGESLVERIHAGSWSDRCQDGKALVPDADQLSPTVTRRLIEDFVSRPGSRRTPHPNVNALTERECEIAGWVATGLANEEIAERLHLSPATVRTHVSRAMLKLNARDRAQLVVFAIQSGLTIPDG
jgi:DNA-binding NarL/FixJ family response regulator